MNKVTLQAKVGSAMRERRKSLGYSQDSFADAIGMHRAYYSAIERGERNVTLATLERVSCGLDCTLAELMVTADV